MKKIMVALLCSCIFTSTILSTEFQRPFLLTILAKTFATSFVLNAVADNTCKQKAVANILGIPYTFIPGNAFLQKTLAHVGIQYEVKNQICTTLTCVQLQALSYLGGMACGTLARATFNATVLPWLARAFTTHAKTALRSVKRLPLPA